MKSSWHLALDRAGGIGRRRFLNLGATSIGTTGLLGALGLGADGPAKHKAACILVFLDGGPSQMETWDPKPGTANGGETKAIATAASGIQIAEYWPKIAETFRDLSIIRTVTSKEGEHGRARYQMHTGRRPTGALKFPNLGSVVAEELGRADSELPNFISLGDTVGPGFLGVHTAPFIVRRPGQLPENVSSPIDADRIARRLALVARQDEEFATAGAKDIAREHQGLSAQALRMMKTPRLKAFDLSQEPDKLRDAYGRNTFGQGLLLARRLVEAGVPFVEVRRGGWDNHEKLYEQVPKLAAEVDPALAMLIADLKSRGELERTLVVCMGEFGRTPKLNPRGGRDHWPRSFGILLAGAGIQGGRAIGKTDAQGTEIVDRPVSIPDIFQTFCRALAIDPATELITPQGRPIKIVDEGAVVKELFT